MDEYKHLIFSVIADDDTLFLVAQSELAAIEPQGKSLSGLKNRRPMLLEITIKNFAIIEEFLKL